VLFVDARTGHALEDCPECATKVKLEAADEESKDDFYKRGPGERPEGRPNWSVTVSVKKETEKGNRQEEGLADENKRNDSKKTKVVPDKRCRAAKTGGGYTHDPATKS